METEKLVKPGRYRASITSYAITKTQAGAPQMAIAFGFKEGDDDRTLTWYGTFKEGKGREITIETLLTCGLSDQVTDLSVLADGPESEGLDMKKELYVQIEHQKDQNGKNQARIRWVNEGVKFFNKLNRGEAIQTMQGLNLGADLVQARQGARSSGAAPATKAAEKPNLDDIPF